MVLEVSPHEPDALHLLGVLSHQSGKREVAVELIRKAISVKPEFVDAHNNLGSVLKDQGQLNEAEEAYRQAVSLKPDWADAHNNLGAVLKDQGKFDEAVEVYRQAIALKRNFADAHNNLGAVFKAQGNLTQAVESYRQAISLNPRHCIAYYNLGIVLKEQGKLDEAVNAYSKATTLQPGLATAHNNLGCVLKQQGKLAEAVGAFRKAISLKSDHADAHCNLGVVLMDQGNLAEAVVACRMAITIRPDHADAHERLGRLLSLMGQTDQAMDVYRNWLSYDESNPVALHMLAACKGRDAPERASDGYLQLVFDGLANSFEQNLKSLDYCAPELLAAAISKKVTVAEEQCDILDAGCGTGLCGPYLRPYARHLVGVDLSTGMLRKATERGIYDDLVTSELTEYLSGCFDAYDIIVAADTLVYFGDLKPLLAGAANALRPNGLLVVSAESRHDDEVARGFLLQQHGRYCHTAEYLKQTLTDAGLTVRSVALATLRMECGRPVCGIIALARNLLKNA